ncbi:alpha/beta hydrolase [Amycolatopsis rhabdoformis]|uniref:Alpha/beta hydrolase n=1 Tax=Amycolatopsis rhabdoformis TaxID=1448059 RepID=A0ABZ1IJX7_9PSEU|nr:alpha/beta hydrolase [Amycolatopsis rhabdoformis]WSE33889.1 alpha/beta hydrolase [Amycolatopsis rhabdoformis]
MVLEGPSADAPTVVFEAGAGATRSSWALVQPRVAAVARAVVYDRAGLGRSDPDPAGRTLDRMADDLVDVLRSVGPAVVVGHSAGGPIARLAAARCVLGPGSADAISQVGCESRGDLPASPSVTGLVLVDPTDEAADLLFSPVFRRLERGYLRAMRPLAATGLLKLLYRPMLRAVPADVRADLLREAFTPGVLRTQAEQARTFLDELATWRTTPPALGDVPVTVISGGRPGDGMTASMRAAANAAHAASLPRGRHVIAPRSGHLVPFTEPDVITGEVLRLLP